MTARRRQVIMQAISRKAEEIIPKGSEVILFGSRARNDAHEHSDWDVLILIDKDCITNSDVDEYSYPFWELGWEYNETINAILYTKKDWHSNTARPFYQNVMSDGIRLWN